MARAEVAWEDQPGAWRGAQGKIEDTSRSGVCIRVSVPIHVGATLKIKWHREEFSGIAKYCRRDGMDYVFGIQRMASENAAQAVALPQDVAVSLPTTTSSTIHDEITGREATAQEFLEPILLKTVTTPVAAEVSSEVSAYPALVEAEPKTIVVPVALEAETEIIALPFVAEADINSAASLVVSNAEPKIVTFAVGPEAAPRAATSIEAVQPAPKVVDSAAFAEVTPKLANETESSKSGTPGNEPRPKTSQEKDTYRQIELGASEPFLDQKRSIVFNKLLHLGSGRQQQNANNGNHENAKAQVNTTNVKTPPENQPSTTNTNANAITRPTQLPPNQGSLLPLQDIYLAVGIMSSRLGYSIDTVSSMLDSDHLRGMTIEVKRSSVLMALEAAGIPPNELVQDGAKRMDALNAYEAGERSRFEEYEARKLKESAQIQSEIDRMTAHCVDRIRHNLVEVTQAKDEFQNWQTTKQKETQRISDAVSLFSKSSAVEQHADSKPELQEVGAGSKHG